MHCGTKDLNELALFTAVKVMQNAGFYKFISKDKKCGAISPAP
jgi:hypothetical protein